MTAAEWRRAKAKLRVAGALAQIQLAQDCLGRALAELSTLRHGMAAHKRVSKLYDRVHAEWYRTAALRDNARIEVDRDPTPEELAQ